MIGSWLLYYEAEVEVFVVIMAVSMVSLIAIWILNPNE